MRKYFDWAQSATESRRAEVALSAVLRTALWRPASFDLCELLDVFCALLWLLAMFGMANAYAWVESMNSGELCLKPWAAAPRVRSAAPIDLKSMAAMWMRKGKVGGSLLLGCNCT